MREQSKAACRRFSDGAFHSRYFVGEGIDIGGKPDPLTQYRGIFSRMSKIRVWDLADGDAQTMTGVGDGTYDFVHSSHCLEHMRDVREALTNWIRIVKPAGYLVITVPDEDLYEHGLWPSRFNPDHKWSFTIHKNRSKVPRSVNLIDLLAEFSHLVEVERIELERDFFRDDLAANIDQTLALAECAIEIVLRKREFPEAAPVRQSSPQAVLDNLGVVRDAHISGSADDIPHGVVLPFATYSPWRQDQAFLQAYEAAKAYTAVDRYRAYELWQLVGQVRQMPGDVLDAGMLRDGTAVVLGKAMQHFGADGKLLLWNSHAGAATAGQPDTAFKGEDRASSATNTCAVLLNQQGVANYEMPSGALPDAEVIGSEFASLKLCHINPGPCRRAGDIFDRVWPHLLPGGIVIFDDYGFLRCEATTRQVNELAERSDLVLMHNLNGHAVLVKRA
jgi:SAM-dependent methyltransferase